MKTTKQIILSLLLLLSFSVAVNAQGWIQDRRAMYSAGVGVMQVIFLPTRYYPLGYRGSQAISMNISGEYRVSQYVGLGWHTGMNVFASGRYYSQSDNIYYYSTIVGIPIGFKANFHILEATSARVKDKLDVYAGFNVGGGPAFHTGPGGGAVGFMYAGPQAGVRYWFGKVAVFGEVGWGASIVNAGITF